MFTGIVEELGKVRSIEHGAEGIRMEIEAKQVLADAQLGSSIAVNGCCLTVIDLGEGWWAADAVSETLARTCLSDLEEGSPVNLERPMRLEDRLGGHLVQGHVDGTGEIVSSERLADSAMAVRIGASSKILRYVVEKGSITVDGVSLTVASEGEDGFSVAIIPHTAAVTTLGLKGPGARVNLEVDILAKYVEKLLGAKVTS